jgi:hypothetical protein
VRALWRGQPCHYCDEPAASWDHIIPRALGGSNDPSNLVPACLPCNQDKSDGLPTHDCEKCQDALADYEELQALRARYSSVAPLYNRVVLPNTEYFRDATFNSGL